MKIILDEKLFNESIYTEEGFKDRNDYLNSLADDYGIDIGTVKELASVLGPSEDFDALVTELEDMMYSKFNDSDEDDEDLDKQFSLWSYYSPAMGASFVEDQIDLDWGDDPDVDEWIWNKCSKGFWVKLRDFFNLEDKFYRPVEFNDEGIEDLLVDDAYRKKAAEKSMNDYYDSSKEGKDIGEALNSQDQYDLSSAIYNAVSDVIFNSGKLDIDEKDVKFAFDRFIKKFFLDESLQNKQVHNVNELGESVAQMKIIKEGINFDPDTRYQKGDVVDISWKNSKGEPQFAEVEYIGRDRDRNFKFESTNYGWVYLVSKDGTKIKTPKGSAWYDVTLVN